MASIGSIFVDLLLRGGSYEDGLKRAGTFTQRFENQVNRSFRNVSRSLDSSIKSVISLQGAFGALLGGAGLAAITNNSLKAADQIAKLSDRLGLTTEQLQKYEYAAQLSGVTTEQLETAFGFLNRQIAEGKIPYSDINSALLDLAERTKNAKDGIERTRIATEAFGAKGGARLIPFLIQGKDGLRDLADEAERLGIVLSADTIRGAERFKDQLEILGSVIQRNFQRGFLDEFVDQSGKLRDVYTDPEFAEGLRLFGEILANLVSFILRNLPEATRVLATFAGATAGAAAGGIFGPVGAGVGALTGGTGAFVATGKNSELPEGIKLDQIRRLQEELASLSTKFPGASQQQIDQIGAPLVARLRELGAETAKTGEAAGMATEQYDEFNGRLAMTGEEAKKRAESLEKIVDSLINESVLLETQIQYYGEKKSVIDSAIRAKQVEMQLANEGIVITEKERTLLQEKLNDLSENRAALESLEEQTKKNEKQFQELGYAFTSAFEDAIAEGKKFKDVLRGLAQDILKILTRNLVTSPLNDALSNLFKGATSGSSGGGGFGSIFSSVGNFLGNLIPSFDVGTPYVPYDMLAKVHRGEEIVPAAEAAKRRNGGGNVYNIDARGATMQAVRDLELRLQALAGPGVIEYRVNDAMTRGVIA